MSSLERYYRARYNRFRALLRWRRYLPELIMAVKEVLPDAELYVFGSALREELTANSDIDVLIVSNSLVGRERHKIGAAIEEKMDIPFIFEMHLVSREKVDWYRRHAGQLAPAEKIASCRD